MRTEIGHCRKSRNEQDKQQHPRALRMQHLPEEITEPAAPDTPEPPSREAEAVAAPAEVAPASAAQDPVADALKGNEALFSGKVDDLGSCRTATGMGCTMKQAAEHIPAMQPSAACMQHRTCLLAPTRKQ